MQIVVIVMHALISIHALLAESDSIKMELDRTASNFYPRSPCGERLNDAINGCNPDFISIHALLAESDNAVQIVIIVMRISIHALLAESDSKSAQNSGALLRI